MSTEQDKLKVAIQGIEGSFHDIATQKYFGKDNIELIPNHTFEQLFNTTQNRHNHKAVVAIENTVAGTLLPNYRMLKESKLKITGEVYLRIEQNLIAHKGQTMNTIEEVQSHYMAINQCRKYLQQYPDLKLTETEDTALSIKEIKEQNLIHIAGIGHSKVAEIYDLEIIAKGIETNKKNYTRFLVIEKEANKDYDNINKASIVFSLPHSIGSLSKVLSIITFYDINLTKIESLPIVGKEWAYQFYADMTFGKYQRYQEVLQAIKPLTEEMQILGEYIEGEKYINS